jgi:hypothetical protein
VQLLLDNKTIHRPHRRTSTRSRHWHRALHARRVGPDHAPGFRIRSHVPRATPGRASRETAVETALVVQDDIQQRAMDLQPAVVVNET